MVTLEQVEAELARRASTGGAATQKAAAPARGQPAPQYTNAQALEVLKGQPKPPEKPSEMYPGMHTDRSVLRGMTMGLSDPIGAGIATAMAFPQTLRQQAQRHREEGVEPDLIRAITEGVPETYRDIRGTLAMEEEQAAAYDPELQGQAEMFGTGAGLVAATAGPLKAATSAALKRGAAKLGGAGAKYQSARAAAKAAKAPRWRMGPDGKPMAMNKAAEKVLKKALRKEARRKGAKAGAALDTADMFLGDDQDVVPGFTAAGAAAGSLFPKTVKRIVGNTPLGRLMMARAVGKVVGKKWEPYIYTASHPATRRPFIDFIKGGGK